MPGTTNQHDRPQSSSLQGAFHGSVWNLKFWYLEYTSHRSERTECMHTRWSGWCNDMKVNLNIVMNIMQVVSLVEYLYTIGVFQVSLTTLQ